MTHLHLYTHFHLSTEADDVGEFRSLLNDYGYYSDDHIPEYQCPTEAAIKELEDRISLYQEMIDTFKKQVSLSITSFISCVIFHEILQVLTSTARNI